MTDDLDSPPLWHQHHVLWAAFGIAVAAAMLCIVLGVLIAFEVHENFERHYRNQFVFSEFKLARSIAACIPAAGFLGFGMGALILRNKLYGPSLVFVTATAVFAILGFFSIPVMPFILWAVYSLRQKCWAGNRIAIRLAPLVHLSIGLGLFAIVVSNRPSSLHDKIPIAVAFSLLVSDCLIVALIGHLYRTRRMAEFDLGFRISLSTFMAIVLTAATYVTFLVNIFR